MVSLLLSYTVHVHVMLVIFLIQDKLRLITVLGAGLLVGTALAVIIPEGVHTMYEAQAGGYTWT